MRAALSWIVVLLLFFLLRTLAGWPRGVDRDENQNCWNARCLAEGGTDFRGNAWPLVLEDYGDDKHALYAWLLAGLDRLGIEARPDSARLFSMVLVAVGALLFGLAVRVASGSAGWGLVAMGCLAWLPWFQVGPCLSWEYATHPPAYGAMFLGLALVARGRQAGTAVFLIGLAFAVYGYPAAKVLAPLLLGSACVLFWRTWRARIAVLVLGGLLLLPLLIDNLRDRSHTDRAAAILVPDVTTFFTNWISHWLPPFLLYRGDTLPRAFSGFLGVVPLGLAAAALWLALRSLAGRRWWPEGPLDRFALLCLLVFPLPAALTDDGVTHAGRTMLGGVAFTWIAIAGLRELRDVRPVVIAPLLVLTALQCVGNHAWMRFRWCEGRDTYVAFHGSLYGDLRELRHQKPARVLFSPRPEPLGSAFPFIHFGWTAFGSRPVPGRYDEVVTRLSGGVPHLATTGRPEVGVWLGQPPLARGPDLVVQREDVPGPAGFHELPRREGEVRFWRREAAR